MCLTGGLYVCSYWNFRFSFNRLFFPRYKCSSFKIRILLGSTFYVYWFQIRLVLRLLLVQSGQKKLNKLLLQSCVYAGEISKWLPQWAVCVTSLTDVEQKIRRREKNKPHQWEDLRGQNHFDEFFFLILIYFSKSSSHFCWDCFPRKFCEENLCLLIFIYCTLPRETVTPHCWLWSRHDRFF